MQKLFSSSEQSPHSDDRPEQKEKNLDKESTILAGLLIVLFVLLLAVSALLWISNEGGYAPPAWQMT